MREVDVLIVGSGIAGLSLALRAAEHGQVLVLTKSSAEDSSTNHAQGGIAAVFDREDSFRDHERDTLVCGAGLSDPEVVRRVVREAPGRVAALAGLGVPFNRTARGYALGREGGHSHRRIVHASDFTGQAIERVLIERVRAHPRIRMLEGQLGVDLILDSRLRGRRGAGRDACWGAYVMDRASGRIRPVTARVTVLATGGCGKVYLYTSNPDVATGDGIAMAYRAGAPVANLEFVQFHPTCLYHAHAKDRKSVV
jgi:L-aspartate oxidase